MLRPHRILRGDAGQGRKEVRAMAGFAGGPAEAGGAHHAERDIGAGRDDRFPGAMGLEGAAGGTVGFQKHKIRHGEKNLKGHRGIRGGQLAGGFRPAQADHGAAGQGRAEIPEDAGTALGIRAGFYQRDAGERENMGRGREDDRAGKAGGPETEKRGFAAAADDGKNRPAGRKASKGLYTANTSRGDSVGIMIPISYHNPRPGKTGSGTARGRTRNTGGEDA